MDKGEEGCPGPTRGHQTRIRPNGDTGRKATERWSTAVRTRKRIAADYRQKSVDNISSG